MKPRQTVKNYHSSNAPPYQHLPNSTTPPTLRDIDLVKLGLNLDDMPNLQANNPNLSNQEEFVKCLQAFCGKNSATPNANTKLPTLNDWPMQSVSPSDYSRIIGSSGSGLSGSSFNNNSNNNSNKNNISNISGTINNNPGQQQKQPQDIQFSVSHQHPHQPSSINHHFRVSSSNIHSPQQQPVQQHQKSVLSLHHQPHQHHQNDLTSNRRLNHHHMSSANASFTNLSTVNVTNATPTSNSSALDVNNLNSLGGGKVSSCGPICGGSSGPSGLPAHAPNIMDTLGSMDNMFYEGNMMINKEAPANQQQSLMKHQHLQKLLKATGSQLKSSGSSTLSHRNESQSQRNITSNMPQSQLPISSQAPAISPPQAAFASVPKSLLNLAACTSSTPSTNASLPSASKFSSMVSQLNLMSARNASASNQANINNSNSNSTSNIRSFVKNNNNNGNNTDGPNSKGLSTGSDHSNLLQHMTRSNSNLRPNNVPPSTRSCSNKQVQLSLLSDDQSSVNRTSSKTMCNINTGFNLKPQANISNSQTSGGASSKEAYLASLQERAARVGVSIGEIGKSTPSTNIQASSQQNDNVNSNSIIQQNIVSISPNQNKGEYMNSVDRKEIESALSRVEARNDLSLLYPPMLLASNSQKQINALSAGLEGAEDSELFTKEVKKIVMEECNIIYECKECNNLFRSLANLVKHKRTYCVDNSSGRNSLELNKRSYANPILPTDQHATTINSGNSGETHHQDLESNNSEHNVIPNDNRSNESSLLANHNNNSRNSDRRTNLSNMIRFIQNQEKKNNPERDLSRVRGQNSSITSANNPALLQTSLSKLLQSQPKNRLPVSRDSVLIGALNATPISSKENPLSALESDKKMNCSSNELVHEQLVRNSSLAKTLLNEKVRVTNPKQSLSEFSKLLEQAQPTRTTKRVAPKRKFLEDCIQKVKRDKLLTEEEGEEAPTQAGAHNTNAAIGKEIDLQQQPNKGAQFHDEQELAGLTSDISKFNSPGDSGDESDVLTIDLDSAKKRAPSKKAKRRISTAASSIASSSSPSVMLNSSSALLKALTRPVDTKRSFDVSVVRGDEKVSQNSLGSEEKVPPEETSAPDVLSPLFPLYTCDYCDLDVEDPTQMMDHMLQFHSKMMIIFPCLFCSFSFISMENVCRHIIEIHKKPRAQIDRLKEVVRSRSFESPDFSACRDCPPSVSIERAETISNKKATSESDAAKQTLPQTPNNSTRFEGMKTRGKKRVDYNQMINNDISETESTSSKSKKSRSRSADQQVPVADMVQGDDNSDKAASVDGDLMVVDGDEGDDLQREGQVSLSSLDAHVKQQDSNEPEESQDAKLDIKLSTYGDCMEDSQSEELSGDLEVDLHQEEEEEDVDGGEDAQICDEEAIEMNESPDKSKNTSDVAPENAPNQLESEDESFEGEKNLERDEDIDAGSDNCDEDGSSEYNGASSPESQSSSGSSSTTSSSGSTSSSSDNSSSHSNHKLEFQNNPHSSATKQFPNLPTPCKSLATKNSRLSSDDDSSQQGEINQHATANKHTSSSSHKGLPPCLASESEGIDEDSSNPHPASRASNESKQQSNEHQSKQNTGQKPSSSTKSNLEATTPSSNSTGGSGGIMKLKIQLKTRPDEKSKVYEIV